MRKAKDMTSNTLYDFLKLKPNCSSTDISKAWSIIETSIPRSNPQYRLAKSAYETLIDPVKREIYDNFNIVDFTTKDVIDNCFEFSSECLESKEVQQVFGKLKRQDNQPLVEVRLPLSDIYIGKMVDVKAKVQKPCKQCLHGVKVIPCPQCSAPRSATMSICPMCKNTRTVVVPQPCLKCNGKKVVHEDESTKVVVKPGAYEGQKLRCTNGVSEVVLRQIPHHLFHRRGDDLYMKKRISIAQSLCGVRFVIKHLDGRQLLVTSPLGNVLRPGCRKVIPKEGMPIADSSDGRRGDLIVAFHILIPNSLQVETAREIENFLPKRPDFKMPENPETEEYNLTEFDPNFKLVGIPQYDEAYFDDKHDKSNLFNTTERCTHQ